MEIQLLFMAQKGIIMVMIDKLRKGWEMFPDLFGRAVDKSVDSGKVLAYDGGNGCGEGMA